MTTTKIRKHTLLLGSVSAAVILTAMGATPAAAAAAAASAPGTNQLEEVVVTAQKRSENIQNVPIAVTAFTAQALKVRGISDVHQMANLTPNVNLDEGSPFSGSSSVLSASIRGIGQDDFAMNLDPGVGVYIDGVYLARTVGANQSLLDVDRVEILKGPQGTLFGRNTIGGAISVVTHTPGSEYTGTIQATTGSFNRRDFGGTFDIPLADTLRTSLTFSSSQRDGYQKRIPYPTAYVADPAIFNSAGTASNGNTQGGQNQQVIRAKAIWTPRNDFKVTLTADETHEDQTATANTVIRTVTSPADDDALFGMLYNFCVEGVPLGAICGPRGPGINGAGLTVTNPAIAQGGLLYSNATAITGNKDTTYATGNNYSKMDSYGASVTLDWDINSALEVKSITSYRGLNWRVGMDEDGSVLQILEPSFIEAQHQVSQELQVIGSALDSRLHYVAGLYYFNEGGLIHDFVTFPGGLLQIDGLNLLDTTSYAAFAHVDFKVTDQLSLTVGGRYSVDMKRFEGMQHDLNAFNYKGGFPPGGLAPCYGATSGVLSTTGAEGITTDPHGNPLPPGTTCQAYEGFSVAGDPLRYFPAGVNHQQFNNFSPTVGIQYHVTPDLMVYASGSSGFKTGGWTTRLSFPLADARDTQFGPEKDNTIELGVKSEWFDRHLIVNAAGFYSWYNGIQLNVQEGISPTTKNAGNAVIPGVELEGQAIFGHGFSLGATIGYMDARYTYTAPGTGNDIDPTEGPEVTNLPLKTKLPKTPNFKLSLSPQYDYTLANNAKLRFLMDYTHTSSMYNDIFNTPELKRPDTDIVNLSVQYISPSEKYTLIVGGTNVTNQRFLTTGQDQSTGGLIYGTYNPPAEWYLTLRVKM